MDKTCVITGLGLICSLGDNVDACFDNAVRGVIGIDDVKSVNTEKCYAHKGGEAPFFHTPEGEDRASALCVKAAEEAVADARLDVASEAERVGVVIGSCVGGAVTIEKYYRDYLSDPESAKKEDVLKMPISAIANNVALRFGVKGAVDNVANACAAGTMSIARACDIIRDGLADVVIAGGSDPFSSLAFSGFIALHAIDSDTCAPFNRSSGISLGEGSGVVIVESAEHAAKRGARVYCTVLGSGVSSDAHHITAPSPDGEGQMTAMRRALAHSGLKASDIDYINAHGTGTPLNDSSELTSMLTIFGKEHACASSTKSMVGHCLGAAGSVEAVFSIKAIEKGIVPPTAGYTEEQITAFAEKSDGFDIIPNKGKAKNVKYALSNNYAFGGNNASIVYAQPDVKTAVARGDEKVYITGIGVVSPLGNTAKDFADAYTRAVSGEKVATESATHSDSYESSVGNSDYEAVGLKLNFYRKLDKLSRQTCVSGKYALADAGLEVTPDNCTSFGIVVGTSDGPQSEIGNFQKNIIKNGNQAGSAFVFPNTVYNAAGGYLSICTGIKGYNVTVSNGFASGLTAIAYAADVIKNGDEKVMLAVGTDENSDTVYALYEKLGVFANGTFTLSEGAVTLALEKGSSADTRGATKYAEVVGYGFAHDPVRFGTFGKAETALRAASNALAMANVKSDTVKAVYGCGGIAEADAAINAVFGQFQSATHERIADIVGEGRAAGGALATSVAAMRARGQISGGTDYALVVGGSAGGSYTALLIKKVG